MKQRKVKKQNFPNSEYLSKYGLYLPAGIVLKKSEIDYLLNCVNIHLKYPINKSNIVGHSDIASLRKIDPGEKFPWKYLADNGIGIWHGCKSNLLKKNRNIKIFKKKDKIKFIKNTNKIGYCFSIQNKSFFRKNIKSFQRHYRKELINGVLDKECMIIAQNLSKKV